MPILFLAVCGLSAAEGMGSPVFYTLWSYVLAFHLKENIRILLSNSLFILRYGILG